MKTLKLITALVAIGLLWSCSIAPEPINYGQDGCHFCKMTIVDKVHAAEIVTTKGKVKFVSTLKNKTLPITPSLALDGPDGSILEKNNYATGMYCRRAKITKG